MDNQVWIFFPSYTKSIVSEFVLTSPFVTSSAKENWVEKEIEVENIEDLNPVLQDGDSVLVMGSSFPNN